MNRPKPRRSTRPGGAGEPGPAGDCFVFGPHLLPGDVWPRALTRLVAYPAPLLQPRGMLLGLGFSMALDTLSNVSYRLETSADLQTWQPWLVFQGDGGTKLVSDPASLSLPQRFYRAAYDQ